MATRNTLNSVKKYLHLIFLTLVAPKKDLSQVRKRL